MAPIDDGPAFQRPWSPEMSWSPQDNPELLDWFAGMAIDSAARQAEAVAAERDAIGLQSIDVDTLTAELAYDIAEAMLAERRKRGNNGPTTSRPDAPA